MSNSCSTSPRRSCKTQAGQGITGFRLKISKGRCSLAAVKPERNRATRLKQKNLNEGGILEMLKIVKILVTKEMVVALVFIVSTLFLINSGFSEMRITTQDGRTINVPVNSKDIKIIEFTQDAASLSIEGIWDSSIGFQYQITQSRNTFTWEVLKPIREHGQGTISGNTISASWRGDNGSGSASGRIIVVAPQNRANRIEWSNGVIFFR